MPKRLRIAFWIVGIVLGGAQAWQNRHVVFSDGIAYLDITRACLRGEWGTIINAYWSPLYPCLLASAFEFSDPSPFAEATALHVVNFAIYLFAFACFEFLLRGLIRFDADRTREHSAAGAGDGRAALTESAWLAIGYSLFIWSSLFLITLTSTTPDMLLAALVYAASGVLVQIRTEQAGRLMFALLGGSLGLGYLAKAVMFPLAFVFLGVGFLLTDDRRAALRRTIVALAAFLLVCAPFIFMLSSAKGRLTFGDSGKLNYAWEVQGLRRWTHWQGDDGGGSPRHPTRRVSLDPPVYEFAVPLGGTYPPWVDPSYWHDGVEVEFDFVRQAEVFAKQGLYAGYIFFGTPGALFALLLLAAGAWKSGRWRDRLAGWFVIVPALAALGMYSLVFVERRYTAPFVTLLCLGAFAGVRLPASRLSQRSLAVVPVLTALAALYLVGQHFRSSGFESRPHVQWQAAESLRRMGVRRGDKAALIADPLQAYWAQLAEVKIVAEIPCLYTRTNDIRSSVHDDRVEQHAFWRTDAEVRERVYERFAAAGASFVVADEIPPWASSLDGWRRVEGTNHHVRFLHESGAAD